MAAGADDPDGSPFRRRTHISPSVYKLEDILESTKCFDIDPGSLRDLEVAAEHGNTSAQVVLGLWCHSRKDFFKARRYLDQSVPCIASEKESLGLVTTSLAFAILGGLCDEGGGGPVDRRRAFEMYMNAAEMGLGMAQFNVAEMYMHAVPDVVERDYEKAVLWFERVVSESAGSPEMNKDRKYFMQLNKRKITFQLESLKDLFILYLDRETGLGCHPVKALVALFEAAKYCPEAQTWLGAYLCVGPGQFADKRKARIWLRKAAVAANRTATWVRLWKS